MIASVLRMLTNMTDAQRNYDGVLSELMQCPTMMLAGDITKECTRMAVTTQDDGKNLVPSEFENEVSRMASARSGSGPERC